MIKRKIERKSAEKLQHEYELAKQFKKWADQEQALLDIIFVLTYKLTGMTMEDMGRISIEERKGENTRRLVMEKSKQYRFNMIKRQSEYSLKGFSGPEQQLRHLLDDFINQLDNELDVMKRKVKQYGC